LDTYLIVILSLYILKEGFEYFLQYLNLAHGKRCGLAVPDEFQGAIDEHLLKKAQEYEREKTRFSFVSSVFGNIVTIVFLFGGILNLYNACIVSLELSFILSGLIFALLLSYGNTILSIPFSLYSTFRIENKYGFNTMTPKLWIADLAKSLVLSTILASLLITVGLWLIESSPDFWWVWVWGFFLFSVCSSCMLRPMSSNLSSINSP
jgi:STE24 endopeptidase